MKRTKRIIGLMFFISSLILMLSCENNVIYFNIDSQTIRRCDNKGIRYLEISNDSLKTYYSILWSDVDRAPNELSLKKIDIKYKITLNGIKIISNEKFKLMPNVFYAITHHSNGDASSQKCQIYLSENMDVLKSSKSSCQ